MSEIGTTLNKNKPLSIGLALMVMVIAGWFAFATEKPPIVEQVYFFDLSAGELYIESSKELPPTKAPSGGNGAWAYVFSCGDCADESSHQIGYLITHTPEYKQAQLAGGDDIPAHLQGQGTLIRAPKGGDWVALGGRDGQQVIADARRLCGDGKPTTCTP